MKRAVVTGAAGFIGGHLCRYLKERGYWVRAVDYVTPRYGDVPYDEGFWDYDLRTRQMRPLCDSVDEVYALAADMGGMGYIGDVHQQFDILYSNAMINLNTAFNAKMCGVGRVLYTSSACVYPESLQTGIGAMGQIGRYGLKEEDAWDGKPDMAYGIEKLFSEELYYWTGNARIARFHNIYGPMGSWNDGREKAPAAMCRKIAEAKRDGRNEIEVWGDGEQIRSFCYIEDCLVMLYRLMQSDYGQPLNIGTSEAVTINKLADMVSDIAGIDIVKIHDMTKPQGVRQRNADLDRMRSVIYYDPQYHLEDGLERTYRWIENQVLSSST